MAEKDVTERLRRAVKGKFPRYFPPGTVLLTADTENNLFLVKRLIQRTEMRNIDPAPKRYTSLAWAAVLGHEETFEFLLIAGHDDEELSKDSENNTILMLLADNKPPLDDPYAVRSESPQDRSGATMRMARLYYDRYPWILDWSNAQGKTALHIASTNGNEELVRMLCDFDADFDLADNKGNTALHYASSWNSLPVVRLLIERGCQYTARNNEGYTASDYAYSSSTRDTLQDTARLVFEQNKKARRQVFAQAAEKGDEWGRSAPIPMSSSNSAARLRQASRVRSGSGTSRSGTGASETGEVENGITTGPLSRSPHSSSASPPHHVGRVNGLLRKASGYLTGHSNSNGPSAASGSGQGQLLNPPKNSSNALSPVTTRMLERDADAMEKYNQRNRSGSSSTDNRSQNGSNYSSAGPSTHGDELAIKNHLSGATTPRRLRPSASAAQLRTIPDTNSPPLSSTAMPPTTQSEQRHRAGTTPVPRTERPSLLARTSSTSTSPPSVELFSEDPNESYIGPPSQYAHFPDPPQSIEDGGGTPTNATANRRKGFHILSKPLPGLDQHLNGSHRRGPSAAASVRGA